MANTEPWPTLLAVLHRYQPTSVIVVATGTTRATRFTKYDPIRGSLGSREISHPRANVIPPPSERQRRAIVSSRPAAGDSDSNVVAPWQPVRLRFTSLEACQHSIVTKSRRHYDRHLAGVAVKRGERRRTMLRKTRARTRPSQRGERSTLRGDRTLCMREQEESRRNREVRSAA